VEYFRKYHNRTIVSKKEIRRNGAAGYTDPKRGRLTENIKLMSYALVFTTTCFSIRAIYRIIEFAGGWNGRVEHTQVLFNVFDGAMITLAMYAINFFHPGRLLASEGEDAEMEYINV